MPLGFVDLFIIVTNINLEVGNLKCGSLSKENLKYVEYY